MIIQILPKETSQFFIELVAHINSPIEKIKALEEFKNNNFEPTNAIPTPLSEENKVVLQNYLTNHQESLILALMTQTTTDDTIKLKYAVKNSDYSIITRIAPNDCLMQYSSIIHNDHPDLETDLTLIDRFNEDIDYSPYVKSYLYGDPFDEDFTFEKKTTFKNIDQMIRNEIENGHI